MKLKLTLFSLMLSMPFIANAGPGTGDFTLKSVHIEGGHAYLFTNETIPDPFECGFTDRIKLNKDDPGFKEMYSLSLAALASGKKVAFWLRECDPAPWGNVAKAYAGQIKK